jgi:hypothetical protein
MSAARKTSKQPRRTFADIRASYKQYDPEVEGYGDARQWNEAFFERMGFEEAQRVIAEKGTSPRAILGVGRSATWEDIRKAYRSKMVANHPDRVSETGMTVEQANAICRDLNAAYAVLAREFGK